MSTHPAGESFARLCSIMATLRSPGGCPWDAAQTPESLAPYIVEEAYEVLDAIASKDQRKIREELGDLLLQVVFQARIHEELGLFDASDVATGIGDKLLRRHPHVFADQPVADEEDLHAQWELIKQAENRSHGEDAGLLKGLPKALPALQRAQKMLSKSERFGLPVDRTLAAIPGSRRPERKIAAALLKTVNQARLLGVDAEGALRDLCRDFQENFEAVERTLQTPKPEGEPSPPCWEEFWSTHQR